MKLNFMKSIMVAGLAVGLASCATQADLGQDASGVLNGGINAQPGTLAEFQQIIGDSILFETNQTSLNESGKALLEKQYAWLQQYAVTAIQIEGHADERGTRQYNIALGIRRAASVKAHFATLGYAGSVTTLSYGKERPISLCDNISCWSQNRRAVTVVTSK
ncbi:MAG: OmpA family protein [Hyphomicrobiales bacterium]